MEFQGKNIVIVGASSGIGKATATTLSKLGAKLILVSRNEEKLQTLVKDLGEEKHKYYCQDMLNVEELEKFVKLIVEENGAIDGFVYSVGDLATRPLNYVKPQVANEVMQKNVMSFIELTRCITKRKMYNPGLSIVSVSSVSSAIGTKSQVLYCASKGAMEAAVRAMALELAAKNIRVNTVVPGMVNTPLIADKLVDKDSLTDDFEELLKRQYLGIIEPDSVAELIIYLLSEHAKYITGSSVPIDAGVLST